MKKILFLLLTLLPLSLTEAATAAPQAIITELDQKPKPLTENKTTIVLMWFLGSILFSSLSLLTSGIAALFLTAAAIVFLGMGIYSWIKK